MKQIQIYIFKIASISVLYLMFAGCNNEIDPLDEAWDKFEKGNYEGAYLDFSTIGADPEAYTGLGWTALEMDSIDVADRFFQLAETASGTDTIVDIYSGWMVSAWVKGHYQKVVDYADIVLSHHPNYVFAHNTEITKSDVQLHQAFSYFHLGNYIKCNAVISLLNTNWVTTNERDVLLTELESLYQDYN